MKKSISTLLAALSLLFFIGMETRAAKAISSPVVISETAEKETPYVPLPIDTIFNAKNKDEKINISQRFFLVSFGGGKLLSPAYARVFMPIQDEEKKDFIGATVSLSYLKKYFDINDSLLSNEIEIIFEYTTNSPVYIRDLESKELIAINNNYFEELMKNPLYSELKKIRLFEIHEFAAMFISEYSDSEAENFLINYEDSLSISEYLEKVYKKYVPKEYWPVSFKFQKTIDSNNRLPKLKDEILSLPKDSIIFSKIYKNDMNTDEGLYKIGLVLWYKEKGKEAQFIDLYTGESLYYDGMEDKSMSTKEKKYESLMVSSWLSPSMIDHNIGNDEVMVLLRKMCFATATIGDIVELYEQLSIEYQIDYGSFDFSNSPNVDPAWLLDRPTPAPTLIPTPTPVATSEPTPPPYAELTLGNSGQDVLDMKQRFYELGYFRTTEFSDRFTDNTADTVRLFEKNNGLPVDGIADAGMLGVLFSDSAVGK